MTDINQNRYIGSFLKNGSDDNVVGDYSSTLTEFSYTNSSLKNQYINRMIVYVEDSGVLDSGSYGNAITLTNGIKLYHEEYDNTTHSLTNGSPVKINSQWSAFCHDIILHDWGTGINSFSVRWTFGHSASPLILYPGKRVYITVNDDFTGLVKHTFHIQGYAN